MTTRQKKFRWLTAVRRWTLFYWAFFLSKFNYSTRFQALTFVLFKINIRFQSSSFASQCWRSFFFFFSIQHFFFLVWRSFYSIEHSFFNFDVRFILWAFVFQLWRSFFSKNRMGMLDISFRGVNWRLWCSHSVFTGHSRCSGLSNTIPAGEIKGKC